MNQTTKVSVLDLTAGQVEEIEKELELPVTQWPEAPSLSALYCLVLSKATGKPVEEFKALKMRELVSLVSIDEDEDPNQ